MRAVVVGGTGLVGRALLAELAADPAFTSVVSLARRPHEVPDGVEARVGFADVPPANVAFCALGTTIKSAGSQAAFRAVDHDLVVDFARACKVRGVSGFHVVSALGADPASRTFYSRVKGEMERDVRAIGFDGACAYRPSLLLGAREEFRPAERAGIVAVKLLRPILPARYRGIPATTVARAMARHALERPQGWHVHEGRDIDALSSPKR